MPDKQLFTFRNPGRHDGVITAGNFPVAVPSWYLVPALLAGNAVVWKPAEYAPPIADAFARCIHAAGIPAGALQTVLTDGADTSVGSSRRSRPGHVQKVGFTGSSEVGRVHRDCAASTWSPRRSSSGARTRSW
jgi:alpha-ketoglutaric semialdehyde dehydrogenase